MRVTAQDERNDQAALDQQPDVEWKSAMENFAVAGDLLRKASTLKRSNENRDQVVLMLVDAVRALRQGTDLFGKTRSETKWIF